MGNQTEFALIKLGAKAVPFLMPLLEDDKKSMLAAQVISEMNPLPLAYLDPWIAKALDTRKPARERLAALRGIAALGPAAERPSEALHVLLSDSDPKVREQVSETLKAVRDPIVVERLAKACQPQAPQFDSVALNSALCLREIAEFGPAGRAAGESLTPFLLSANGAERAYGILTLGFIDYAPATPQIEQALDAEDWRVVYAAIRAVGWLGDTNATTELDNLASSFWLAELKKDAAQVAVALRSSRGRVERGSWEVLNQGERQDPAWVITEGVRGQRSSCPSNRWQWQNETFTIHSGKDETAHSLRFRNGNLWGELVGTDHGEWGGTLTWIPARGQPEVLDRDNVRGMDYDNDGAIVLFGLAHMGFNFGYALKVSRNADGTWTQTEVARLPGEPEWWTRLNLDRVAVLAGNKVVVFSPREGILGVASCASK
ncbi:MAG: HEAT repeat domain-containing protein [Terracidiphilus sp.]|jgi:HEAT repeat protein